MKTWRRGCEVMPKETFGAHLPQVPVPSCTAETTFSKRIIAGHKKLKPFVQKNHSGDPHVSKLQTFPIGPSPYVRLKFQKKCQVLVVKFWIKWGVVCENLTIGVELMSKKPFWPYQLGVLCSKSLGSFKVDSTFCSLEVNKTSGKK